jgi:predicted dinucleotide-binding enzyme
MKISILGAGRIGSGLGNKWKAAGHEIIFGVRNPDDPKYISLKSDRFKFVTLTEAMEASEIIVVAVPFSAAREVLGAARDLSQKIIIDCTNALSGLPSGFLSAAEAIRRWSGSEKVIKAFNATGSANLENPVYNGTQIDTYICGDDKHAKETVKKLAEQVGFLVVDAGGIKNAYLLEAFATLWINLAYQQEMGTYIAFKLLHRNSK